MQDKQDKINVSVKLNKLKKIVNAVDAISKGKNIDISFEYLVGSCFPHALDNMKDALARAHTQGFVEGRVEQNGRLLDYAMKVRDLDALIALMSEFEDNNSPKGKVN
jgi:hypothetical protein